MTKTQLYNLWREISHIPGWPRVLWLVGKYNGEYDERDLSELEEIDEEFLKLAGEEEKKWRKQNYENLPKTESGWLKVFPEGYPYLEERLKKYQKGRQDLSSEIENDLSNIYKKIKDEFSVWFWEKYLEVFKGERLEWLTKKIKEIEFALNPPKAKRGEITDEIIEKAKQYPIENLIENKKGFALCPFHPDKKPSFFLRNNYAYCFACGYAADSIKLYMDLTGANFKETVQHLSNI